MLIDISVRPRQPTSCREVKSSVDMNAPTSLFVSGPAYSSLLNEPILTCKKPPVFLPDPLPLRVLNMFVKGFPLAPPLSVLFPLFPNLIAPLYTFAPFYCNLRLASINSPREKTLTLYSRLYSR